MGLFLSFAGRIGRGPFWLGALVLTLLLIGLNVPLAYQMMAGATPIDGASADIPPELAFMASPEYAVIQTIIAAILAVSAPLYALAGSLGNIGFMVAAPEAYDQFLRNSLAGIGLAPPEWAFSALYQIGPSVIGALVGYSGLAIAAKRLRDRGQSLWWLLLTLIPLVGSLWWLVNLGILEGRDDAEA